MSMIAIGNAGGGGIDAKYKFIELPTEEAEADADSYVCDFVGAAATNETGVGGGLSGADLVLTQYGNPGTDGVNRTILDSTFQSFYGTLSFHNAFALSAAGWSCVFRDKNLNGTAIYLMNLMGIDAAGNWPMDIRVNKLNSSFMKSSSDDGTNGLGSGICLPPANAEYPEANTNYIYVMSQDYQNGLSFCGFKVDDGIFPTKLEDFVFFAINEFDPFSNPTEIVGYFNSGYYKCIVGSFALAYASNYSGGQTVVSLTMSKKPCFIPR